MTPDTTMNSAIPSTHLMDLDYALLVYEWERAEFYSQFRKECCSRSCGRTGTCTSADTAHCFECWCNWKICSMLNGPHWNSLYASLLVVFLSVALVKERHTETETVASCSCFSICWPVHIAIVLGQIQDNDLSIPDSSLHSTALMLWMWHSWHEVDTKKEQIWLRFTLQSTQNISEIMDYDERFTQLFYVIILYAKRYSAIKHRTGVGQSQFKLDCYL